MTKWNYCGDKDIREGGFYWREDGADDYVLAVRVTPCSAAGGPDNLFYVEEGSIYLDAAKAADVLSVIGMTPVEASRADWVYAALAYAGIERDGEAVVRIGKDERASDPWRYSDSGWNPEPTVILRGNASLRRYIERDWLD
jgi:hypothetical protein